MKKHLLTMGFLSFSFVSCVEIPELEKEEESQEVEGMNGQGQSMNGGGAYGQTMQDNFQDHDFQENNNGYSMYNDQNYGQQQFNLPRQRPQQHGQYSNLGNQYGVATDGSRIDCNHNGNGKIQFANNPNYLVAQNGDRRMIGVHRDGSPIYGHMVGPYDESVALDNHGGRFAPTQDFPSGVYHYVIKISIN